MSGTENDTMINMNALRADLEKSCEVLWNKDSREPNKEPQASKTERKATPPNLGA